jgi:hypothetical protein
MRTSTLRCVRLAILLALGTTALRAQSINVDVGATPGTNPTAIYAAGAPQAGWWSWFSSAVIGAAQPMQTLTGAATGVTLTVDAGAGSFTFNNGATAGNDEALMDDIFNVGGAGASSVWTFHGLAAGGYWVYTYAWAPDNAAFRTKVHVPLSLDPDQTVGGAWVAAIGQQYIRTFSKHFVALPAGANLQVRTTADGTPGSVNGFQLVFGGANNCDGEMQRYCSAKVNSAGCTPVIGWAGVPSASAGFGFLITAVNVLAGKPGVLIYSVAGPAATPFGGGTLCIAPPVKRAGGVMAGGGAPCTGTFSFDFNMHIAATPALQVPGESVWAQYWSRDPGFPAPNNIGLTDGLNFTICF